MGSQNAAGHTGPLGIVAVPSSIRVLLHMFSLLEQGACDLQVATSQKLCASSEPSDMAGSPSQEHQSQP